MRCHHLAFRVLWLNHGNLVSSQLIGVKLRPGKDKKAVVSSVSPSPEAFVDEKINGLMKRKVIYLQRSLE